jgi:hypothetical protein
MSNDLEADQNIRVRSLCPELTVSLRSRAGQDGWEGFQALTSSLDGLEQRSTHPQDGLELVVATRVRVHRPSVSCACVTKVIAGLAVG